MIVVPLCGQGEASLWPNLALLICMIAVMVYWQISDWIANRRQREHLRQIMEKAQKEMHASTPTAKTHTQWVDYSGTFSIKEDDK